ncbi:hypothetical protein HDV00_005283 [Rhizophlyctis rosea]|nr:hypothetical protein HDV00_005283 [Rhizophlyctis rosea]
MTGRWVMQNLCPSGCLNDPSFAANCGRNSHGIANPSTSSSTSTSSQSSSTSSTTSAAVSSPSTSSPTSSSTAPPPSNSNTPSTQPNTPSSSRSPTPTQTNQPASTTTSSTSIKAPYIYGPIIGALLLLLLAFLLCFLVRRSRSRANPRTDSDGINIALFGKKAAPLDGMMHDEMAVSPGINLASVLERRYVVMHEYEPQAEDEIKLNVGDYDGQKAPTKQPADTASSPAPAYKRSTLQHQDLPTAIGPQ